MLRGHAVRALYLTAGAVDLAVETGDDDLLEAVRSQFDRTLARRTYLTGGMGSHHQDEAFGDDFELPPDRSYCETCAGVGSVMVAWRLAARDGRPAYGDVVERALYNVVATSPAADGRSFFYTNPLHKRVPGHGGGGRRGQPACARAAAGAVVRGVVLPDERGADVRLAGRLRRDRRRTRASRSTSCAPCSIADPVAGGDVRLAVSTSYPDDGDVVVRVVEAPEGPWRASAAGARVGRRALRRSTVWR